MKGTFGEQLKESQKLWNKYRKGGTMTVDEERRMAAAKERVRSTFTKAVFTNTDDLQVQSEILQQLNEQIRGHTRVVVASTSNEPASCPALEEKLEGPRDEYWITMYE